MSEEHKRKLSESKKGKPLNISEEQREAMRERARNKIYSEETRMKISESKKKKVYCFETDCIANSIEEMAEMLNISRKHIGSVCTGKRKSTHGFHFEYR